MNNLIDFTESFIKEVQVIENMLDDLKTKRSITTGEGVQLDVIGEIVDELRNGRSDNDYRDAINLKILLNVASGKAETILTFLDAVTSSTQIRLVEEYPAGVVIYVNGTDVETRMDEIADTIKFLLPAGVGLKGFVFINPNYDPFAFSLPIDEETTEGEGFYELGYPENNGYTAGALAEVTY
jgi:hypothetical protein